MTRKIQDFHVGLKAFITNGDRLLVVKGNQTDPRWELPGGRIDVGEELMPAEQVLEREIREELGNEIVVAIGRPLTTWSRQLPRWTKYAHFIGFSARYISGKISLSHEHSEYRWVTEAESRALPLADGYDRALDHFWKNR